MVQLPENVMKLPTDDVSYLCTEYIRSQFGIRNVCPRVIDQKQDFGTI